MSNFYSETYEILINEFPLAVWETLYVTFITSLFAIFLALPLALIMVSRDLGNVLHIPSWLIKIVNGIINILRSIPFLILLILLIPVTRFVTGTAVGTIASIVPLVIASAPFIARLFENDFRELDIKVIEAAKSMGANSWQIILKVILPESLPGLISSGTVAVTTVMGYSAMSGIIGGGGLGKIAIQYGYYRYQYVVMFTAVVFLVLLVQCIQFMGSSLAFKLDHRLR